MAYPTFTVNSASAEVNSYESAAPAKQADIATATSTAETQAKSLASSTGNMHWVIGEEHSRGYASITTGLYSTGSDLTLSWSAPTQREDNSALPASQIQAYVIECVSGSNRFAVRVPAGTTSHTFKDLGAAVWDFRITTVDTTSMMTPTGALMSISSWLQQDNT